MPRLFMYGTELQEMEQLMMLVPGFSPRQKGLIVVGETTAVKGGIKKCRSSEKCGKENCGGTAFTNLTNSMMEMDRITYREMIIECFSEINHFYFRKRLSDLVASSPDGGLSVKPMRKDLKMFVRCLKFIKLTAIHATWPLCFC